MNFSIPYKFNEKRVKIFKKVFANFKDLYS